MLGRFAGTSPMADGAVAGLTIDERWAGAYSAILDCPWHARHFRLSMSAAETSTARALCAAAAVANNTPRMTKAHLIPRVQSHAKCQRRTWLCGGNRELKPVDSQWLYRRSGRVPVRGKPRSVREGER